jgi:hypothetical protein
VRTLRTRVTHRHIITRHSDHAHRKRCRHTALAHRLGWALSTQDREGDYARPRPKTKEVGFQSEDRGHRNDGLMRGHGFDAKTQVRCEDRVVHARSGIRVRFRVTLEKGVQTARCVEVVS